MKYRLYKSLDKEGIIYTMDAMHAQTKILQKVIDNYCDYIVGVKKNQRKLYDQVNKKYQTLQS